MPVQPKSMYSFEPRRCRQLTGVIMQRREFISLAGSAGVMWPFKGLAQQTSRRWLIGYLGTSSLSLEEHVLDAFRQKLRELGHVEGKNIAIEYRWAEGRDDRLPGLAAELVRLKPDVIVTTGTPGTLAAKQATSTIPIVFTSIGDPVSAGLVASFARPEGNVTGFSFTGPELEGKRLQLLKDLVPGLSRVIALWNPLSMGGEFYRQTQVAATALNVTLQPAEASRMDELEQAFATIGRAGAHALIVLADGFLLSNRKQIVEFAASKRLPAMYPYREYVDAGGLSSYAPSKVDRLRRTAVYVDRILRGDKPTDLPVEAPTIFELVINGWTARELGLSVPATLLARADQVIE
jgi:putative ABC transport system substrate-binding protein